MRTYTSAGVTVNYPEAHCYIFNPVPIEVQGISEGAKITAVIGDVNISASAFNGRALFDISQVLQSLFCIRELSVVDTSEEITRSNTAKMVSISIPSAGLTFTTLAIWGALQTDLGHLLTGDFNFDYNSDFLTSVLKGSYQEIIWYPGVPFTVSVPMVKGDTVKMAVSAQQTVDIYTALESEIANIVPEVIVGRRNLGAILEVSFMLYSGNTLKRHYRVMVDAPTWSYLYTDNDYFADIEAIRAFGSFSLMEDEQGRHSYFCDVEFKLSATAIISTWTKDATIGDIYVPGREVSRETIEIKKFEVRNEATD